jgi:hypothetical protein
LDPAPLLSEEDAERLFDHTSLRHLYFDCRQSLVLPGDGEPGWFILPQSSSWWFLEQMPADVVAHLQQVYRHNASQFGPSYEVYYWPENQIPHLLSAPSKEAELVSGQTVTLPYALNDALALKGYRVRGDNWFTEWQINQAVHEPLSLQAHLYTDENSPPLVGDSLGFSSEQWLPGDRLLQRFEFPGENSFRYLQTTAYDFSSLASNGEVLRLLGK